MWGKNVLGRAFSFFFKDVFDYFIFYMIAIYIAVRFGLLLIVDGECHLSEKYDFYVFSDSYYMFRVQIGKIYEDGACRFLHNAISSWVIILFGIYYIFFVGKSIHYRFMKKRIHIYIIIIFSIFLFALIFIYPEIFIAKDSFYVNPGTKRLNGVFYGMESYFYFLVIGLAYPIFLLHLYLKTTSIIRWVLSHVK